MPMTQEDIRRHYETSWKTTSDNAASAAGLAYSNSVEDAVMYPIYERLLHDLQVKVTGGRVLDVGSGSGRWIRFFLDRFAPQLLVGVDFTQTAIDLLRKWSLPAGATTIAFEQADITDPSLRLQQPGPFDLINIANVLFHIPENDKFINALNLARHLASAGRIVTTEYLPRTSMRTEWMLVRSRYEFQAAVESVGLRIAEVRASSFFSNDPMGIDGPDGHGRGLFAQVRGAQRMLMDSKMDEANQGSSGSCLSLLSGPP